MFYNSSGEYNDCVSHGACSIPPNISSMNETMGTLLKQTAYYLINSIKLGYKNKKYLHNVLYYLAFIDSLKDFSESKVIEIFSDVYLNLNLAKNDYIKLCKKQNILCVHLKNIIKFPKKLTILSILKLGEKQYYEKNKRLSSDKKYLNEILLSVIKNTALNLINLTEYDKNNLNSEELILESLNYLNLTNQSKEKLKDYTCELSRISIEILEAINSAITEKYGIMEETSVSLSTRPNKAILVSGSNLNDLSKVLNASQNYDIDIYTNGNLLLAHSYPYFKNFKNLKGHFGNGTISNILDFATFPGAILLTKHETQNIEYLYRGRLFTTEKIEPKGVSKIENNDFSKLIDSAMQAKGFAKGQIKENKVVGFNLKEIDKILDDFLALNPQAIFITGFIDNSVNAYNYLKIFLSNLPNNFFAISFSHNIIKDNILFFDICNNFSLSYFILKKLFSKIKINNNKIHFLFTKCDVNTLTSMIYLKNKGAKNISLLECSSTSINPAVLKVFNNIYNINKLTNPILDLKNIVQ